jgi:rhodanese-related sulfurtransferase/DNA-binding transcriptional ArsR family regulator
MKNKNPRDFKDQVWKGFAEVTKALGNPKRLELVDLLVQRPRSVEGLATALGAAVGNTSQHLQVLKRARVVQTTRSGTTITYALADGVSEVFVALRRLADSRSDALARSRTFFEEARISRAELEQRLASGTAVVVDVRPRDEFDHGHIADALSIPIEELTDRLDQIPRGLLVVATCRGPYCVFAEDAVRILKADGRDAVRFEDGVAEWAADGGHIAGASS